MRKIWHDEAWEECWRLQNVVLIMAINNVSNCRKHLYEIYR